MNDRTITTPSGRLLHTDCWKCGIRLPGDQHSCDGFMDAYGSRACQCKCHESGRKTKENN